MTSCRHIKYGWPWLLWCSLNVCIAQDGAAQIPAEQAMAGLKQPMDDLIVEHLDPIETDSQLTLGQLVEQTLEKYPDRLINEALQQEAEALKVRGDSWLAGSTALALDYADDTVGSDQGAREASANLEFTVWNWGQRSAAQNVADQAQVAANKQSHAVKWEVARLVREALWDMALAEKIGRAHV